MASEQADEQEGRAESRPIRGDVVTAAALAHDLSTDESDETRDETRGTTKIIGGNGYEAGQWRWELWPMTFGKWRLVLTDGITAGDFYCMKSFELAVQAWRDVIIEGKRPSSGWTRRCVDGVISYPDEDET